MNNQSRSNMGQKRIPGKQSPLSKRPKLDFCTAANEPCVASKSTSKPASKEYSKPLITETRRATTSDWDEEFSGDMLEKVCLIADLSQAMVSEEADILQSITCKKQIPRKNNKNINNQRESSENLINELDRSRIENEKLRDNLKTKEGEVQILRSQLKQHQETKHADVMSHMKAMEEVQKKYQDKLSVSEKECESMRARLQFTELEMKSLKERCKQMEASTSTKVKLVEPHAMHMSQFTTAPVQRSKVEQKTKPLVILQEVEVQDGKSLSNMLCPYIFTPTSEQNIFLLYNWHKGRGCHASRLDFDNREKYLWSGFPVQRVFLKHFVSIVSQLFLYNSFNNCHVQTILNLIVKEVEKILNEEKEVLEFLIELQKQDCSEDPDKALLEDEDPVYMVTQPMLLGGEKLHPEECGLEARRALALLLCILQASPSLVPTIISFQFLTLILDLIKNVASLRRPVRYPGVLIATTNIIRQVLCRRVVDSQIITLLGFIIKELIFCRAKLNVMVELIDALTTGHAHTSLMASLCPPQTPETSPTLYVDSNMRQIWFFTSEDCPLKLLCVQIKCLATLPSSAHLRCQVTSSVIAWLSRTMDSGTPIHWLPKDCSLKKNCYDVVKLLVYLLNLCVADHQSNTCANPKHAYTIADGAVLLQRFEKMGERLSNDTSQQTLKFSLEVGSFAVVEGLSETQKRAIEWLATFKTTRKPSKGAPCLLDKSTNPMTLLSALKLSNERVL